jgi:xanthine permease XanP
MTTTSASNAAAPPAGSNDLIYPLEDQPSCGPALFPALQHVLTSFVCLITAALIIVASQLAPFVQAKRLGPIGFSLLPLHGTRFAFLSTGMIVKSGSRREEILST